MHEIYCKAYCKVSKRLKTDNQTRIRCKKLSCVVKMLSEGVSLPEQYKDHWLKGEFKGCRECHIQPDWLLIYEIDNNELILYLTRTGTHSDLFKE